MKFLTYCVAIGMEVIFHNNKKESIYLMDWKRQIVDIFPHKWISILVLNIQVYKIGKENDFMIG